jgi:NodT family efflux transporter outer membrane factor (OMF) lipoprotein
MRHFAPLLRLAGGTLLVALAGCAPVGPDFVRPETAVPDDWSRPAGQQFDTTSQAMVEWWRVFQDPVLNDLVERARKDNNTVEIAALRVLEAQAQLGVVTGLQYPQTQLAAGEVNWVSPPGNSAVRSDYWTYSLGASISWEMDFWGRYRRGIESAEAAFQASIAAYDQAMVLLTAAVVENYVVIRTLEEQLRIARENLKIQQRSYEITEVLFRNGSDSELDMQQANTLLLATQANIPALEASLRQADNALDTLLGASPGQTRDLLTQPADIPALPQHVAIGFPADMLRRRPDVRQAELLAMAQNAQIGLAKADLYPSFSLSGSIGLSAGGPGDSDFGDLFDGDALAVSIGPSFVWPFLNYGRIRSNVRVQDARLQQALVNYRETVLQAAREAEDAIAAYAGATGQSRILAETVASARRSNEISTLRYQEGFSDYQRVLDSQQALFTQQQRYITSRGDAVRSLVALYKALGGGWQGRAGLPYLDDETLQLMQQRTDWGGLLEAGYAQPAGNPEQD